MKANLQCAECPHGGIRFWPALLLPDVAFSHGFTKLVPHDHRLQATTPEINFSDPPAQLVFAASPPGWFVLFTRNDFPKLPGLTSPLHCTINGSFQTEKYMFQSRRMTWLLPPDSPALGGCLVFLSLLCLVSLEEAEQVEWPGGWPVARHGVPCPGPWICDRGPFGSFPHTACMSSLSTHACNLTTKFHNWKSGWRPPINSPHLIWNKSLTTNSLGSPRFCCPPLCIPSLWKSMVSPLSFPRPIHGEFSVAWF